MSPAMTERIRCDAAARILGVTVREINELTKAGEIPNAARVGSIYTYDAAAVERLARSREQTTVNGSVVYVIQCGDMVKIGYSRNVGQRLAQIRTSNPGAVRLVATLPGGAAEEKALHQRFAEFRSNGEWFHRRGAMRRWILGECQD
jgi:hypothetical protein